MANNLFVSYDLITPGQGYDQIIGELKKLGAWAKIHYSLWYVKAPLSASQTADRLRKVMDQNDKLIVVDATNNEAAWYNLPQDVAEQVRQQWLR